MGVGLLNKLNSCLACPLYGSGKGFIPADGSGMNNVLIVGEAGGQTEERIGKPFMGAAGFYLNRLLKRAGLKREEFRVHNVLSCTPPGNKLSGMWYEHEATRCCAGNLRETIEKMQPRVIIALGGTALRALTGYSEITRYRGHVLEGLHGGWVVPTFHPSFLLPRKGQADNVRYVGAVIRDLRLAMRVAREGFVREEGIYLCDPSPEAAGMFKLEYESGDWPYLAFDIETPYKMKVSDEDELEEDEEEQEIVEDPITRISFAFKPRYAMSVPWSGPYMGVIKELLRNERAKAGWNAGNFDVPKIRDAGVEVNGELFDFMWGWHILHSSLPKKLEFVASFFAPHILPWKHLNNAQPALYSALDSDATVCIALEVEKELRERGQWEAFKKHSVRLDPILHQVGRIHGVNVDIAAQNSLRGTLIEKEEILTIKAQEVVPEELKPKKVYKKFREDAKEILVPGKVKRCSACGALGVTKSKHKGCKAEIEEVDDWVKNYEVTLPFNPNSTTQLMEYVKHFHHPIGSDHKTQRASLGKKHMERLAKKFGGKHPIYQIALDMRGVRKTLGTYVDGFKPDEKGLIYTTYSHNPRTPRLASGNKNLQNISHRGTAPFAKEVRRTIVPPKESVWVEADSSAIEAVMVGYFMGDPQYISYAHQGIHDILTCAKKGLSFDVNKLAEYKADKEYKKLRDVFKIVVHATSYRMGPKLMVMQFPENFKTIREAQEAQEFFTSFCPGLRKWQWETMVRAHKETYLSLPWGYRGYFYDVFTKDSEGNITPGSEANACVAYLPQGAAACFLLDNLLLLWDALGPERREWMRANVAVHDSYALAVPMGREQEAIEILEGILTRPIVELGGLRVGCEIAIGPNWSDMESVKIVRVE